VFATHIPLSIETMKLLTTFFVLISSFLQASVFCLAAITFLFFNTLAEAQSTVEPKPLTEKQKSITLISAFTAKGELTKLKQALNTGLDAGLTINESKEVLVHLYAYCGFPRSIAGLQTLMATLDERKGKGIKDIVGREATPIHDKDKYETGYKNLAKLGGRATDSPIEKPTGGYGAFSPEIDRFLKEHLFADLFSRDVLTFAERELTTISVLIALGSGVEPMLGSHLGLTMKQGFTKNQIEEVFGVIEKSVSKADADAARKVFEEVLSRN
jgi:alkylhydroperoxidase/carboxymuconolactone decarboxylase family protein YurZ